MRVLRRGLKRHEIDHIDDAKFDVRKVLAKQIHGGQRFEGRHIARASHDRVRLAALISTGPGPDANSVGAMLNRRLHV